MLQVRQSGTSHGCGGQDEGWYRVVAETRNQTLVILFGLTLWMCKEA